MSCKFYREDVISETYVGGDRRRTVIPQCTLKEHSEEQMYFVHLELLKTGREGSICTTNCPMAEARAWTECPFRQV